jgi:hypothetical protein
MLSLCLCIVSSTYVSVCVAILTVVMQQPGKHVPAARDTRNAEVLLDESFSLRSVSYKRRVCESVSVSLYLFLCGGAIEYLHRSPSSRKRRRKGIPVPGGISGPPCSWGILIRGPGPPGLGVLKSRDNKIWYWVPRDSDPSRTALSSNSKLLSVPTAWRVLGLRMEERPPDMEVSCEYIE